MYVLIYYHNLFSVKKLFLGMYRTNLFVYNFTQFKNLFKEPIYFITTS